MLADSREFDAFTLRRDDYTLTDAQDALRVSFSRLLAAQSPPERLRDVEASPPWFDTALWRRLCDLRVVQLGIAEEDGGDGGGLVELALVAEEVGRTGAHTAVAEVASTGRLLARLGTSPARAVLAEMMQDQRVVSLVPSPDARGRALVPCGTVAESVVAVVDGGLVMVGPSGRGVPVKNLGSAPLAWWDLEARGSQVLASQRPAVDELARAVREWRLLTAAALVGVAQTALDEAVEHAKHRHAFGAPIGSYQAVSHPLVDAHMAITAARRLVRKAAWFEEFEPGSAPDLPLAAVSVAASTAITTTSAAVHTLGGLGVTTEVDAQLWYRRAKGWAVLLGDADSELAGLFQAGAALDGAVESRAEVLTWSR